MSSLEKKRRRLDPRATPYLLLAPGVILIVLFMGYPLIYSIRLSLLNYNLSTPGEVFWNSFENYKRLFQNPELRQVMLNSLVWVLLVVSIQFIAGFGLAMLLRDATFRGKGAYQAVVFLPWAIPAFLIGLIFKWLFNQHNGFINWFLMKIGVLSEPISWLGSSELSFVAPIVSMIWYGIPFFAIMLLAALQSVPTEVRESADMDGASYWTRFFRVELPYIKPTIIVTLLLRVIWVFNSSDTVYVTTKGGPANSSNILPLYIFNQAYYTMDFGYGAAAGILMMVLLVIYTAFYLKATNYKEAGDF